MEPLEILRIERRKARRYHLMVLLCKNGSEAHRTRWAGLEAYHQKQAERWENLYRRADRRDTRWDTTQAKGVANEVVNS